MSRSILLSENGDLVFYTMGLFQTADREMAKSKIGEEEACLNKKQKKKVQVKRCDIDNGDRTREINTTQDRESPTENEALAPRTGG